MDQPGLYIPAVIQCAVQVFTITRLINLQGSVLSASLIVLCYRQVMKRRHITLFFALLYAFFLCFSNSPVSAQSNSNAVAIEDNNASVTDERPSSQPYQTDVKLPVSVHTTTEIYKKIKEESEASSYISYSIIGKSSSDKNDIMLVKCSKPGTSAASTIRLLVLCRQHGDEPASTEAMNGLIERLAMEVDPRLVSSLENVTLYIIPIVNPDGADSNSRYNAENEDLNRDWGYFTQAESIAVNKAVEIIKPHMIIDAHNWDSDDPYDFDCIEIDQQHNTAQSQLIRDLQDKTVKYLNEDAYRIHPVTYGSYCNQHLAHRYYASCGILSMLVETHSGDSNNKQDFQRRQGLYSALVHFIIRELSVRNTLIKSIYVSKNNNFNVRAEEQLFYNPGTKRQLLKHEKSPLNSWLPMVIIASLIIMYLMTKRTDNLTVEDTNYTHQARIVWLQSSDMIDERLTCPFRHRIFGFKKPILERSKTMTAQKQSHARAIEKQLRTRHDIHQYRY